MSDYDPNWNKSKKSSEMEKFLSELCNSTNPYGRTRESGLCPTCKNDDDAKKVAWDDFRDDLSREEYRISHLCQKCQDEVWGE